MIRRDYILRMIEEFIRAIARINEKKKEKYWREAESDIEGEILRLTGCDPGTLCSLTDTEILAALLRSGEFQAQSEKSFMLARLLIEAAEVAEAQAPDTTRRALRLKALHLLLHTSLRGEVYEWPEYVPTIDLLLQRFQPEELPVHTEALLMQHFERTGQFAKAEDALHAILQAVPNHPKLREMALSFYHRLLAKPDAMLTSGDLPRDEIEMALKEIERTY